MEISKSFTIDAAHRLTGVPPGHKCGQLHGHTFCVEVHVRGNVDPYSGFILDFAGIGQAFAPIFEQLDHTYLNDIEGLENPTSENLAKWIWDRLKPELTCVSRIVVKETPSSCCSYEGI
ncbi:MAG: 6-carboxytetrahydropterin synthase QueD [Desulfuromonadaceae bacterium]